MNELTVLAKKEAIEKGLISHMNWMNCKYYSSKIVEEKPFKFYARGLLYFYLKGIFYQFDLDKIDYERELPICLKNANLCVIHREIEVYPFCKLESTYVGFPGKGIFVPNPKRIELFNGQIKELNWYSTNNSAAFLIDFGIWYEYDIHSTFTGPCMKPNEEDLKKLNIRYWLYGYGYFNYVDITFSIEDLLNMNPNNFSTDSMACFKRYLKANDTVKKCLDFNIFKRELTDLEKADCALKFLKNLAKNKTIK